MIASSLSWSLEAEHQYYLVGSWNKKAFHLMKPLEGEMNNVSAKFTIGYTCKEEFQIVRDRDMKQALYPALSKAQNGRVPLCGPDGHGNGKCWQAVGQHHDTVTVTLRLDDDDVAVTMSVLGQDTVWERFESWALQAKRKFAVCGSFNDWLLMPMQKDDSSRGVHRCRVQLRHRSEGFNVVVDEDPSLQLFPDDQGRLEGPSTDRSSGWLSEDNSWVINGVIGGCCEIVLDLRADRNKMVSWKLLS